MTDSRSLLAITPEEKQDLEGWAQSRTLPAGDVFRARLLLALAAGKSYRQIESGMQTSAATIARWRMRFEQEGLAGLEARHRGSRPRRATAAVQRGGVPRGGLKTKEGSTHWGRREVGPQVGLRKYPGHRNLPQGRLKRHRP